MTEAQRRLIDSHMMESMAQSIRLNMHFSFNPYDMADMLERCAKIVRPKPESVK